MNAEILLLVPRLMKEESFLGYLYDDANDKPVKAPVGNATIGYGCNVQAGWTEPFAQQVLQLQVQEIADALGVYLWYQKCNSTRRMVLLDIAFNDGVAGLLHFPHMLSAIMADDWQTAADNCKVTNPELAGRYAALAQLLLTGNL